MNNKEKEQIKRKYAKIASWYDFLETIPEFFVFKNLRKKILKNAKGKILEVAVGTGKNLHYYPKNSHIDAIDLSKEMIAKAKKRAKKLQLTIKFTVMDVEKLTCKDNSFDTVVSTMGLCTYPNPIRALKEMSRVCKKNGRILLFEHGKSSNALLARVQNTYAKRHFKMLRCHLTREPVNIAKQSGLRILSDENHLFGIFTLIEAKPRK